MAAWLSYRRHFIGERSIGHVAVQQNASSDENDCCGSVDSSTFVQCYSTGSFPPAPCRLSVVVMAGNRQVVGDR